jgi:hypothetical protein
MLCQELCSMRQQRERVPKDHWRFELEHHRLLVTWFQREPARLRSALIEFERVWMQQVR